MVRYPIGHPGAARRLTNWAKAQLRWRQAGRPVRSPEHVQALRQLCESCQEYYRDGKCVHPDCGCPVDSGGMLGDKLQMATESCPIGRWPISDASELQP